MFTGWKNSVLTKTVNSQFKKIYDEKIHDLKIDYSSIINDLKRKILLSEKNISLVEQKHSEISFVLANNLNKAVTSLNKKILELNNDDLKNFKVSDNVDALKTIQTLDQKFVEVSGDSYFDPKNAKTRKVFK